MSNNIIDSLHLYLIANGETGIRLPKDEFFDSIWSDGFSKIFKKEMENKMTLWFNDTKSKLEAKMILNQNNFEKELENKLSSFLGNQKKNFQSLGIEFKEKIDWFDNIHTYVENLQNNQKIFEKKIEKITSENLNLRTENNHLMKEIKEINEEIKMFKRENIILRVKQIEKGMIKFDDDQIKIKENIELLAKADSAIKEATKTKFSEQTREIKELFNLQSINKKVILTEIVKILDETKIKKIEEMCIDNKNEINNFKKIKMKKEKRKKEKEEKENISEIKTTKEKEEICDKTSSSLLKTEKEKEDNSFERLIINEQKKQEHIERQEEMAFFLQHLDKLTHFYDHYYDDE